MFKYKEDIKIDIFDGVGYRFYFENGYGAIVIRHSGSYGSEEGLWELGVLDGDKGFAYLTYDTPITDDVIGRLTTDEVNETLDKIKALSKE